MNQLFATVGTVNGIEYGVTPDKEGGYLAYTMVISECRIFCTSWSSTFDKALARAAAWYSEDAI